MLECLLVVTYEFKCDCSIQNVVAQVEQMRLLEPVEKVLEAFVVEVHFALFLYLSDGFCELRLPSTRDGGRKAIFDEWVLRSPRNVEVRG